MSERLRAATETAYDRGYADGRSDELVAVIRLIGRLVGENHGTAGVEAFGHLIQNELFNRQLGKREPFEEQR